MPSCQHLTAVIVALAIAIAGSAQVRADIAGASITFKGLDLQFAFDPDTGGPEVPNLLFFGESGVVERMVAIIVANARQIPKADLTIEIEKKEQRFEGLVLSSTNISLPGMTPEGRVEFLSGDELLEKICAGLRIPNCAVRGLPRLFGNVVRSQLSAVPPQLDPIKDLIVTIGNLPADPESNTIWLKDPAVGAGKQLDRTRDRNFKNIPVRDAINELATRSFRKSSFDVDDSFSRAALQPKYFTVHCTAFAATDDRMRQWVSNNKKNGRRNKSHGVILPSGEYLPMWPFDDRKVWATKTETCKETTRALGAMINIELHYFCGSRRSEAATDAQYEKLTEIYKTLFARFGPLKIVSHRETDRGLHDGHGDPYGFSFSKFYQTLKANGVDTSVVSEFSDQRHRLSTGRKYSHHWEPQLKGGLVLEKDRLDDCQRDKRP